MENSIHDQPCFTTAFQEEMVTLNFKRNPQISEDQQHAMFVFPQYEQEGEENAFDGLASVKMPPFYVQRRDSYDQQQQQQQVVHPSIAGFPSHVRKVHTLHFPSAHTRCVFVPYRPTDL